MEWSRKWAKKQLHKPASPYAPEFRNPEAGGEKMIVSSSSNLRVKQP
jgi:hypothetical protein